MPENQSRAPLSSLMAPDWAQAMQPVAEQIHVIGDKIKDRPFLPRGEHVLRAFSRPMHEVRVLVVGQDPYPTPGDAVGLSFAVAREVALPASLRNVYAELETDLGIQPASHGDLTSWQDQGVMLLNRVLTVSPGAPASHRGIGWEHVTKAAIEALCIRHSQHQQPLVALLWGRQAQELEPLLAAAGVPVVKSAHPSPLSAHGGFFGSRPFSRVNQLLIGQGATPIDWTVR